MRETNLTATEGRLGAIPLYEGVVDPKSVLEPMEWRAFGGDGRPRSAVGFAALPDATMQTRIALGTAKP